MHGLTTIDMSLGLRKVDPGLFECDCVKTQKVPMAWGFVALSTDVNGNAP